MRRESRIAILVGSLLACIAGTAGAQPGGPGGPEAPREPAAACVPACRAGFMCHQGQCISACNPACAASELCAPNGECVSRCNPACGINELCTGEGACVSRCNPVCSPGQSCTATGQCVGPGVGVGAGGFGGVGDPGGASPGWGKGAFILSIVAAAVIGALTTGIVIANDEDIGLGLGIPATLIGGVAIPIVAVGGGSARRGGGVRGSPALRITGWVLYGIAMADALVLIALGLAEAPAPAPVAGSVGLLGIGSALSLGIDARNSAVEAEITSGIIQPGVGVARDANDKLMPTLGLKVTW